MLSISILNAREGHHSMMCIGSEYSVLQESEHKRARTNRPFVEGHGSAVAAVETFCCVQNDIRDWKTPHRSKVLTIHICEDIAWVDRVDPDTILSMQHGKVPGDLQTSTSSQTPSVLPQAVNCSLHWQC